jgi:hypothetical protein
MHAISTGPFKILLDSCTALRYKVGNIESCVSARPSCRVFSRTANAHARIGDTIASSPDSSLKQACSATDTDPNSSNFLVVFKGGIVFFLLFTIAAWWTAGLHPWTETRN